MTEPIIGLIFEAFKELGYGFQEKYYQRAFEEILKKHRVKYKRELSHPIEVEGRIIGRYFIDFLINDQVIVEWKVADDFFKSHTSQVLAYLKSTSVRIALIACVTSQGVKIKRLVN